MHNLFNGARYFSEDPSFFSNQMETFLTMAMNVYQKSVDNNTYEYIDLLDYYFSYEFERLNKKKADKIFNTGLNMRNLSLDQSDKEEFFSMIKIEKKIFGSLVNDKKILKEVTLLSEFDSKYLLKIYECFISNKFYYLITEHCSYSRLNEKLRCEIKYTETALTPGLIFFIATGTTARGIF